MKNFLFTVVGLILLGSVCPCFGQQDPLFTQYLYNMQLVNPAYAGSREALTVSSLSRLQWIGIEGRPMTQTLNINTPLFTENFGVGLAYSFDQVAVTRISSAQLDLAVRLPVGRAGKLGFGLKGGLSQFREGLSGLFIRDNNDPDFAQDLAGRLIPNVGAGFYFQHERYYLGVSVPELLENQLRQGVVSGGVQGLKQRHYYAIAGMAHRLKDRLLLKVSGFVKYTQNAPVQAGITARFEFRDQFMAGIMYRHRSAAGLLLGINLTEQMSVGYSFDWSIGLATGRYNGGSHEIGLRYDFLYRHSQTAKSPRYF